MPDSPKRIPFWKRKLCLPLLCLLLFLSSAGPYIVRPAWFDEVLTLDWLVYPFLRIPFLYKIPNNHILYTLCLSLWKDFLALFGLYGTLFLRCLSLIFASVFLLLLWKRLVRAGGNACAFSITVLLAGSGVFRLFGTALRGYMPGLLFCFIAFLAAEDTLKHTGRKNFFRYFLFAIFAVATIPSDLLALGAGLLFLLPPAFRSKKQGVRWIGVCLLSGTALAVSYLHIAGKFLKASRLAEGWSGYWDFCWNLYGSWLFFLLPVLPFCIVGFFRLFRIRKLRFRLFCFMAVFLLPMISGLCLRYPPFPRVFFPWFGVWAVIACYLVSGALRGLPGKWKFLPAVLSLIWVLNSQQLSGTASDWMFGSCYGDDLLRSYPMSGEFQPQKVTKRLAQAYYAEETETVFLDFDADPPSLEFLLANQGIPKDFVLKDRPDLGKVLWLSPGDWIVCRDDTAFERLRQRFSLKGTYHCINEQEHSMQRIYVPGAAE